MLRLLRLRAGILRAGLVAVFSTGLAIFASANPLPSVPAPHGGECDMAALSHGLWLGHFTGGRFLKVDATKILDWRDQYSCFASGAACRNWERHLTRAYRQVVGYRTCLPLR